jgi:IS605 OrfB family transposase
VGINTAATAAIVDSPCTVIARTFLTCGRHNDRRDALAAVIAEKHSLSGFVKKKGRHCVALHRRIAGYSLDAARGLASEIAAFAAAHGVKAFVIEDLKGWRPKGPSRAMRKRFHRFQHRALVAALAHKAQELGARLLEVFARGTSRWAYDGSGKVTRSKDNAQLATFASGKKYNADLNGALNIAARGLAMLLGFKPSSEQSSKAETGKSSGPVERMPLVLADIWAHAQLLRGASNRPASPAGVLA